MNFCNRLRDIRNELKTIEIIQEHSLYNLKAYNASIQAEIDRLELNLKRWHIDRLQTSTLSLSDFALGKVKE